ncbi:hypothetical protein ACS0TY_034681 [Phlomoides rotata]
MKIFSWLRNKRNGNEDINKPNQESTHHDRKNRSSKEELSDWANGLLAIGTFGNNLKESEVLSSGEDELDKELRLLLSEKEQNLTVEELLDCLLKEENNYNHVLQSSSRGRKDVRSDNKKRGIGKKSFSFLIKKAFLCTGGFPPSPMLRDPLPDLKLDHSRMEKILRAMLHKKIYPQRPTTSKKYLENDEEHEEGNHESSKWVKTDSEYIVLEI